MQQRQARLVATDADSLQFDRQSHRRFVLALVALSPILLIAYRTFRDIVWVSAFAGTTGIAICLLVAPVCAYISLRLQWYADLWLPVFLIAFSYFWFMSVP